MNDQSIYLAMFDNASVGILLVNQKGIIIKANPFIQQLFGYEPSTLIGQSVQQLVPASVRKNHHRLQQQYFQHPQRMKMDRAGDLLAQHQDGHTFPVSISLDYIKTETDTLAVTYISNIAYQKQIQADLKESQARLAAVINQAADGIIAIDDQGIIEAVNPAAAILFGYENEDLLGENVKMLMPEPDRSGHDQYIEHYKLTGKRKIIGIGREVTGKRKDGSTFPLQLNIKEVMVKNRKIFISRLHNLSEKKATEAKLIRFNNALERSNFDLREAVQGLVKSEKQLKEAQATLQKEKDIAQMYLDIAGGMIVVLDTDFNISLMNQRGVEILEIEQEDVAGKNWFDRFIPAQNRQKLKRMLDNFMATSNGELVVSESHVLTDKGNQKLIWWHHRILVNEYNELQGVINSGVDITNQRQAETLLKESQLKLEQYAAELESKVKERTMQLEESNSQLEQSLAKEKQLGELKSRFVSMASHEFRTPLTSIGSSASLIESYIQKDRLDRIPKNVERIRSSIRNLTEILNDFLSFERLEVGKVSAKIQTVNIAEFVEELVEEIQPLLRHPDQLVINNDLPESIQTDSYLLRNILLNLLSNAIKYSSADQPIQLKLYPQAQQWVFEVADRGMGIPEKDQEHLFSLFFRATNAENIKGTGLGLVIVKRYLNLLGGTISFESQEGEGSRFRVFLPVI